LAVSEPKTGAHPKHMRTAAVYENGLYRLNGEKTYLTNGPVADLYVTIAITGGEGTNKEFTAFLIPRDTPGLTITAPLAFPYLKPAAHGGIKLNDCILPASAVLGKTGQAYRHIVTPFRWIEDTMMAGAAAGGMSYMVSQLTALIRLQKIKPDSLLHSAAGDLFSMGNTARILALETAAMLDPGGSHNRHPEFDGLLWSSRQLCNRFLDAFDALVAEYGIEMTSRLDRMAKDFRKLTGLAENVARIKQRRMGARLIGDQL
jgi:alkylation response protein AidB-like acyl-CoA dehydrogenase